MTSDPAMLPPRYVRNFTSVTIPSRVLRDTRLRTSSRLAYGVLLVLADPHAGGPVVRGATAGVAGALHCTQRAVQTYVHELEECGYLTWERHGAVILKTWERHSSGGANGGAGGEGAWL